ncbi:hypothetical protein CLOM_g1832 [Closterium sp. NIES-68]|nr:hypothetical protein CLOM_g1832 [Closterium sp. NIES-68]
MERGRRPAIAIGQLLLRWSSAGRRINPVAGTAGRNQRAFSASASDLERSGPYRADLYQNRFPGVPLRDFRLEPAGWNDSLPGGLKFRHGSASVAYQPVGSPANWWMNALPCSAASHLPLRFPVPRSTTAERVQLIPALSVPSAANLRGGPLESPGCGSALPLLASSVKRKRRKKMNKHKEKKRRRRDKNKR